MLLPACPSGRRQLHQPTALLSGLRALYPEAVVEYRMTEDNMTLCRQARLISGGHVVQAPRLSR